LIEKATHARKAATIIAARKIDMLEGKARGEMFFVFMFGSLTADRLYPRFP
jgi:hypothetical protein